VSRIEGCGEGKSCCVHFFAATGFNLMRTRVLLSLIAFLIAFFSASTRLHACYENLQAVQKKEDKAMNAKMKKQAVGKPYLSPFVSRLGLLLVAYLTVFVPCTFEAKFRIYDCDTMRFCSDIIFAYFVHIMCTGTTCFNLSCGSFFLIGVVPLQSLVKRVAFKCNEISERNQGTPQ
jgi:hypothetical protein